jgi:hypothetical protein
LQPRGPATPRPSLPVGGQPRSSEMPWPSLPSRGQPDLPARPTPHSAFGAPHGPPVRRPRNRMSFSPSISCCAMLVVHLQSLTGGHDDAPCRDAEPVKIGQGQVSLHRRASGSKQGCVAVEPSTTWLTYGSPWQDSRQRTNIFFYRDLRLEYTGSAACARLATSLG